MNELNHVAIMMDGNGRWAELRGKSRKYGHEAGAKIAHQISIYAAKKGIKYLTLFAFSTENWKRPKIEINFIMGLLKKYIKKESNVFIENGLRFETIGDLSKLDNELQEMIFDLKEKTKHNSFLTQILAINYGSKDEIARACKKIIEDKSEITCKNIDQNLDTKDFPDVDLLIRTGGERRLSNFMLWQSAYAELFFTDTYWPDFSIEEFEHIIEKFLYIKRRFGGL